MQKIKFNVPSAANNNATIDYEFCIPKNEDFLNEVTSIDATLKKSDAKGRSKCSNTQYLMIGTINLKDGKEVLCKISTLDYVKEINQTFWE